MRKIQPSAAVFAAAVVPTILWVRRLKPRGLKVARLQADDPGETARDPETWLS